jgi:hypothetical protein
LRSLTDTVQGQKAALGLYDKMDPVHHAYRQLKQDGYRGTPIHNVVVDEVQDLTQAELQLFFMVCREQSAFFFAGDTAQVLAACKNTNVYVYVYVCVCVWVALHARTDRDRQLNEALASVSRTCGRCSIWIIGKSR